LNGDIEKLSSWSFISRFARLPTNYFTVGLKGAGKKVFLFSWTDFFGFSGLWRFGKRRLTSGFFILTIFQLCCDSVLGDLSDVFFLIEII